MVRLAQKAFHPGQIPFPLLHVDTGYKFPEMYEFRDRFCREIGADLRGVPHRGGASRHGANPWDLGTVKCCASAEDPGAAQRAPTRAVTTPPSAARGATRRSRAPRSASTRSATRSASGTRRTSGPSCGTSTTAGSTRARASASSRSPTGPSSTSGSTSTLENIPVVPLYFAKEREVVVRGRPADPGRATATPADAGREAGARHVPLPHAGLLPLHRRGALDGRGRCRRSSRR